MKMEVKLFIPPAVKAKPDIRELTKLNGISYPSDEELIMLIINKGTRDCPVEKLARKIMRCINSSNPEDLVRNLMSINGIGDSKALSVAAALELGRRRTAFYKAIINKPTDLIPYIKHYSMEPTEHFVVASLNGAHELLNIRVISIGTTNRTMVHPREVLAEPVSEHAAGIICCHNHPYGPCIPSIADRNTTKILREAASVLGITLLDHIILTKDSYFSFLEHSLLYDEKDDDKFEEDPTDEDEIMDGFDAGEEYFPCV